jgi:hypothetical protein
MLLFLVMGCSSLKPRFDQDVFPENYHFPNNLTEISKQQTPQKINQLESNLTHDIVNLWVNNEFKAIYQQNHPILGYNRNDIVDLYYHLVKSFDIFYISSLKYNTLADKKDLVNQIKCIPLSNFEIKFILNNGSISTVSSKRLTILNISLHEAMLRKGFQPVYPKIRSSYLRKLHRKPSLRTSEDFNAINEYKNFNTSNFYAYYFLFCRKDVFD